MESHYNKEKKDFARTLRKNSTLGEVILWDKVLKNKKMLGFQFLRQFSIDGFIVDFICRKLKLIIEIDGYSHQFKTENDENRDKQLVDLGYTVLRFSENEVKHDLNNVIRNIENTIKSIPLPPSPRGI